MMVIIINFWKWNFCYIVVFKRKKLEKLEINNFREIIIGELRFYI